MRVAGHASKSRFSNRYERRGECVEVFIELKGRWNAGKVMKARRFNDVVLFAQRAYSTGRSALAAVQRSLKSQGHSKLQRHRLHSAQRSMTGHD